MSRVEHRPVVTTLEQLDFVVVDLETTGLDVRRDRIVQIGAVRMRGARIAQDETFETRVDPQMPIPALASRIHGLADEDVAGAPPIEEVLPRLLAFLGDQIVIGHAIGFDLAILRHEAARVGIEWREPRALDVGLLAAALDSKRVDPSLDDLARAMDIALDGRNTALGDAIATARIFAGLFPELRAAGVRTLPQAEALARRPRGLVSRQEEAGWHDRPDSKPDFADAAIRRGAARAIDGFLYRHRLADVMSSPPLSIDRESTLAEAAARMKTAGIGCLIVEPLVAGKAGIVTERDVLRALGAHGAAAADLPVGAVMSAPVIAAPGDTLLFRALGGMARRNLRYLAVTAPDGRIDGVFTLRTLLRERALATLTVGDEIAAARSPADLAGAHHALAPLAASLMADAMTAPEIAAVISAEIVAMTAKAAELAEAELVAAGAGRAPAPWCLLVLGSAGRGESLLAPDQDNALVVDDRYRGDLDDEADWFACFGARVSAILAEAGVPPCRGGVMACERKFRRRLSEWGEAIAAWVARPEPEALLDVDTFYDFAPAATSDAAGAHLAHVLREIATQAARAAPGLARTLGAQAMGRRAPLGLLGGIRTDEAGRVDLKAGALAPITAGARAMALRHGIAARATPERLLAATRAAGTGAADARLLADIHAFVSRLVIAQQIADVSADRRPSAKVDLKALEPADRERLREALGHVDLIGEITRAVLAASAAKGQEYVAG